MNTRSERRPSKAYQCSLAIVSGALLLLIGCRDSDNIADNTIRRTEASPAAQVSFPNGYREKFTNYLSLDRVQNHDQIIRLFANDIAMQGPAEDGRLPFGSVIVGEVYKAKLDRDGNVFTSGLGRRIRDKLALVAVMERGEHLGQGYPEDLDNGNWEFGAFKPDGTVANKDMNSCRKCHSPLKESDHLFSLEHLPTRAIEP